MSTALSWVAGVAIDGSDISWVSAKRWSLRCEAVAVIRAVLHLLPDSAQNDLFGLVGGDRPVQARMEAVVVIIHFVPSLLSSFFILGSPLSLKNLRLVRVRTIAAFRSRCGMPLATLVPPRVFRFSLLSRAMDRGTRAKQYNTPVGW
ncbi:hypothetical protein BHE74_00013475 [Ensete ventricosum]|nr:hypothetical protein BHE74_00013475 [Ensete ventricosum]